MKTTTDIITRTFTELTPALAFSGGGDSLVLLDIIHNLGYKPPLVFADSQMEYQANIDFVKDIADRYQLPLHIARHKETPQQVWQKHGYPMLGKQSAREWQQSHKDKGFGFIAREDESKEDVFLHFSELNQQGFKTVEEGDELEFEVEMGPKGPKATNVDKL